MKKNDTVLCHVEDLNNLGYGVGHINGMTVFVSGAVEGDVCDVHIIKVNKTYAVGIVQKFHTLSSDRLTPECGCAQRCGGCAYASVTYEYERKAKQKYVEHAFRKAGLPDVAVDETVSDGKLFRYRNKAQYPVGFDGKAYSIGFYAPKSHRVCDAADCVLQPEIFSHIVATLRRFFDEKKLSVYDENTGKGLLRHIYLRLAQSANEVLVTLVLNGDSTGADEELVSVLTKVHPEICGILLNENRENTNVVLGKQYRTLFGKACIDDVLCSVRLEIAPAAFYQVNHGMAELLYKKAEELASLTGKETVYDLYCGTGSIGLSMAHKAASVVGIEIEPSAVACAIRNAEKSRIKNARFFCADASDSGSVLSSVGIDDLRGSVVILDPPRKGSTPELIGYICEKEPLRVVYISCNPDTLARDCAVFRQYGYLCDRVTPFDLFPRTGHVESVVLMSKI